MGNSFIPLEKAADLVWESAVRATKGICPDIPGQMEEFNPKQEELLYKTMNHLSKVMFRSPKEKNYPDH